MALKVLCVAEKPSIAKSVAQHLSGGHVQTVSSGQELTLRFFHLYATSVTLLGISMSKITILTIHSARHGEIVPLR